MTIKTQKVIRFIPFANIVITVFQFYKFYHKHSVPRKNFFKTFMYIALLCTAIAVSESIIDSMLNNDSIKIFIDYIATYLYMFIISTVVVKDQEKLMNSYK